MFPPWITLDSFHREFPCVEGWLSILGWWWWWSNLNFSWNIIQKLSLFPKSPNWTASRLLLVPHSWAIIPSRALKWASFENNVVNIPKKENNFKLHNILLLFLPLLQFQWDLSSHFLYAFASEFRVGNNGGDEKRSWGLIKFFLSNMWHSMRAVNEKIKRERKIWNCVFALYNCVTLNYS